MKKYIGFFRLIAISNSILIFNELITVRKTMFFLQYFDFCTKIKILQEKHCFFARELYTKVFLRGIQCFLYGFYTEYMLYVKRKRFLCICIHKKTFSLLSKFFKRRESFTVGLWKPIKTK